VGTQSTYRRQTKQNTHTYTTQKTKKISYVGSIKVNLGAREG